MQKDKKIIIATLWISVITTIICFAIIIFMLMIGKHNMIMFGTGVIASISMIIAGGSWIEFRKIGD